MADNLPPLFGPSALDGNGDRRDNDHRDDSRHAFSAFEAALRGELSPVEQHMLQQRQRQRAPFRKGQLVRQTHGPGVESNQRCVVSDIKFLNNVSGFSGWAIKLDGRAKPFDAAFFEAIKENTNPQPGDYVIIDEEITPEPETRVFYDTITRTYRAVIGDMTILFRKMDVEGALPRSIRDAVLDRAPHLSETTAARITLQLIRAASTAEQRAAEQPIESEPLPPVDNGKRRRIIRPGEQG